MKYETDNLCNFKVEHAMDGVKVTMNSKVIESYFIKSSNNKVLSDEYLLPWDGNKPYKMPRGLSAMYNQMLEYWQSKDMIFSNNRPNMSFIRCEGLKDGVSVVFKTPCSNSYLNKFKRLLSSSIYSFYTNTIEPSFDTKKILREYANIPLRYKNFSAYLNYHCVNDDTLTITQRVKHKRQYHKMLNAYGVLDKDFVRFSE